MAQKRNYRSKGFKKKLVQAFLSGESTARELGKKHSLSPTLVRNWAKKPEFAASSNGNSNGHSNGKGASPVRDDADRKEALVNLKSLLYYAQKEVTHLLGKRS